MTNDLMNVLHRALSVPGMGLADSELLSRFVSSRDEATGDDAGDDSGSFPDWRWVVGHIESGGHPFSIP